MDSVAPTLTLCATLAAMRARNSLARIPDPVFVEAFLQVKRHYFKLSEERRVLAEAIITNCDARDTLLIDLFHRGRTFKVNRDVGVGRMYANDNLRRMDSLLTCVKQAQSSLTSLEKNIHTWHDLQERHARVVAQISQFWDSYGGSFWSMQWRAETLATHSPGLQEQLEQLETRFGRLPI